MAGLSSALLLLTLIAFQAAVHSQDAADSPELVVLLTERHTTFFPGIIYKMLLHHRNYTILPVTGVVTPVAIDYDTVNRRIYWADISSEEVRSTDLDGGNNQVVASLNNISYPESLAVDDEDGKVFYTDRGNNVIVSIDVDSFASTIIFSTDLDTPWGIVADKTNKMLYWVDHGTDKIETSLYDGRNRSTVADQNIFAATGITMNEKTGRLYWCEYNGEVKSILKNGTGFMDHITRRSPIRRFMDISLYNGNLYITDRTNREIVVIPEDGGDELSLTDPYFGSLNGIHVFSPNSIETGCTDGLYGVGCTATCGKCSGGAPCEKTVGVCFGGCDDGYQGPKCSEVCDAGTYGYKCTSKCGQCKSGTTCHHLTGDCPSGCEGAWFGDDCKEIDIGPELIILLTERHTAFTNGFIYKLAIHHMNFTAFTLRNVITPVAIDYDKVHKRVYWTDISTEKVRAADLDGDNDVVVASLNNVSYPEGLAVDGEAGKVFYTDRGNRAIVSIDMNGFASTTIVSTDLDTPWGIVADKKEKKVYWVDHGSDTIEGCYYDGRNRTTVTADGVYAATGIAINENTGRLYWCEYNGEVYSIFTNGTGKTQLVERTSPIRRFMDISLFNGFLYLTERTEGNITVIPEDGGTEMHVTASSFGNLNGLHVFSPNTAETACQDGMYGVGCTSECGRCSTYTVCEKTVGVCLAGCAPGYLGQLCKESCSSGTYGKRCSSSCGKCAAGTTCNHETGICPSGCEAGWKGSMCQTRDCSPGWYGQTICLPCGQCQTGDVCNSESGVCPGGCQGGWNGTTCQDLCPAGTYGKDCRMSCGTCLGGIPCNRQNGTCIYGCEVGWTGDKCTEKTGDACPAGTYGPSCLSKCGNCSDGDTCDSYTGICPNGCSAGYKGSICKLKCTINWYGKGCRRQCGYCKSETFCDRVTGKCPEGCIDGWTDDYCQTEGGTTRPTSAAGIARKRHIDVLGVAAVLVILLLNA